MKKLTAICLTLCACALVACDNIVNDEKIQVTFIQADGTQIVKTVQKGEALTDIPTPMSKTGYTASWEEIDFFNLTEDKTVNVVLTAKEYIITYDAGRTDATVAKKTQTVTYDTAVTLATATCTDRNQRFLGWDIQGTVEEECLTKFDVYNVAENITLVAIWEKEFSSGEF